MNAAHALGDLRSPPGNRLEALGGDLAGFHSIRVNDQWRLVFRWEGTDIQEVRLIDYHCTAEAAMIPTDRIPTHPGEVLREEYLSPLGITQSALADHIGVPVRRISEILRGKRGVTPAEAWLFAQAFDTTPEFWLNLQVTYDLAKSRPARAVHCLPRAG